MLAIRTCNKSVAAGMRDDQEKGDEEGKYQRE